MAIRIPSNQIVTSKYTSGGEFIVELTNAAYQGYYYELNNNLYAGKTFDIKSPKLIKIKDRNTLLNRGLSTAIFSLVSGITSKTLSTPKITSLSNGINDLYIKPEGIPKFYCKKINNQPIIHPYLIPCVVQNKEVKVFEQKYERIFQYTIELKQTPYRRFELPI